jgi:hypothetical protein
MKKAISSSETSVDIYRPSRSYVPEYTNLQYRRLLLDKGSYNRTRNWMNCNRAWRRKFRNLFFATVVHPFPDKQQMTTLWVIFQILEKLNCFCRSEIYTFRFALWCTSTAPISKVALCQWEHCHHCGVSLSSFQASCSANMAGADVQAHLADAWGTTFH